MIINFNIEDPAQLVRRYVPVTAKRLRFEVHAVWCNQTYFERLRDSLTRVKVIGCSSCPAGHYRRAAGAFLHRVTR